MTRARAHHPLHSRSDGGLARSLVVPELRVPKHWLLNRDDPRTMLVVSAVVLASGILFAALGAGIPITFLAIWLVAAAAQTIYAIVRVRRRAKEDDRDLDNQSDLDL